MSYRTANENHTYSPAYYRIFMLSQGFQTRGGQGTHNLLHSTGVHLFAGKAFITANFMIFWLYS